MPINDFWQNFLSNIKETRWQEWVSTVTQVASVVYARKNNVLVYPTGIIGVLLAAYVYFFQTYPPLYADASLNVYYFLMSIYGWYNWVQKKDGNSLIYPVSWCTRKELWFGIGFFLLFWLIIYAALSRLTNSNTPVLDSLVSTSAVTAMWWMAKRKIENWIAWIFSNVVAIPLNLYKHFALYAVMYVLFVVHAWMGYVSWKKMMDKSVTA